MKKSLYILLVMICFSAISVSAEEVTTDSISGKILIRDGSMLAEGVVLFFNDMIGPPPDPDKYMRVPVNIANTDDDGRFTAKLPEGKYYIGVLKHIMGIMGAPPHEGDIFFISRDETGSPKAFSVEKGKHIEVNLLSEAIPYIPYEGGTSGEGITAIEGSIYDMSGNPVEYAVVFAHMTSINDGGLSFISDWTDKNGRYLLRVHQGGVYYLRVEGLHGRALNKSGVVIGDKDIDVSGGIKVETGEIERGIDIKVIIPPKGKPQGG